MSKILVVDDEPTVLAAFEAMLQGLGHEVSLADRGERALEQIRADRPDVLVMDIQLPGADGLETFRRIKEVEPRLPVIIITGHGTTDYAIEATKLGAFDYQLKPLEPEEMLRVISKAVEGARLMQRPVMLGQGLVTPSRDAIIGSSPEMQQVYKAIGRVAATDATVLIRGESGTGKELVARALYQHSTRHVNPLLVVNCVAIPETLLESELFGYEKGAFTGAAARRIGKFEQADGGTVFLDEIGDMPLSIQSKILRVLQEKSFERVGGNDTIPANVRIIAATNRNLESAIRESRFREDLYHRLNVVTISIPPLRHRPQDIPLLAAYFLSRFAQELSLEEPILTAASMEMLAAHAWPGNVRELEHCLHRAMIFTRGYPIQPSDLKEALAHAADAAAEQDPGSDSSGEVLTGFVRQYLDVHGGPGAHEQLLELVERLLFVEALRRSRGNQTRAAKMLGIPRPTFHAKLQRHAIAREETPH